MQINFQNKLIRSAVQRDMYSYVTISHRDEHIVSNMCSREMF